MTKLRIVIADDHALLREGMKVMINAESDMVVVGEAESGRDLVTRASSLLPDLVVIDISMPEWNGAQAARRLRAISPTLKIIALTIHEDRSYLRELLAAGASGYVLKRSGKRELIQAIRAVATGGIYIDPRVAGKLVAPFADVGADRRALQSELSDREAEVMRLVAVGHTNREVAGQLHLSVKTVESYRARSMDKLGLNSRVDLIRVATERGWLPRD